MVRRKRVEKRILFRNYRVVKEGKRLSGNFLGVLVSGGFFVVVSFRRCVFCVFLYKFSFVWVFFVLDVMFICVIEFNFCYKSCDINIKLIDIFCVNIKMSVFWRGNNFYLFYSRINFDFCSVFIVW